MDIIGNANITSNEVKQRRATFESKKLRQACYQLY